MTLRGKASRLILVLLSALTLLSACTRQGSIEVLSEEEDPVFRRARDLYARGMENEALENFLKLIQKRNGNAPESHLDAGNIYLKHLRDPISAIYHFKHYEALMERSGREDADTRVKLVEERIKAAKKEFAMTFDAKVYQDPLERLKLLDTIEALRTENETLKKQLVAARDRLNSVSNTPIAYRSEDGPSEGTAFANQAPVRSEPRRAEPAASQNERFYVIQSGDSLYKISRKVYGDGSRWKDILEANRDAIPDERTLKVGTRLRIP